MEVFLKESVPQHPDVSIPLKLITVYWNRNEAFVQGTQEKTFCVEASNLIFEKNEVL